jgi:hypothetical protein
MAARTHAPAERGGWRRRAEPTFAHVLTTVDEGGVCEPHRHCAAVDGRGRGITSAGPDGHVHLVAELEILEAYGHVHALGAVRCPAKHAGRACLGSGKGGRAR